MPVIYRSVWYAALLVLAFSLPLMPCNITCAKGDCSYLSCPALDYGEVSKGEILRPFALIENKCSFPITIRQVLPPICGPQPEVPPVDITLRPHEKTVVPLMEVRTSSFKGPIQKSYSFEVTTGAVFRVDLFKTRNEAVKAMEETDA